MVESQTNEVGADALEVLEGAILEVIERAGEYRRIEVGVK